MSERGTNNGETQIKDHSEARCATNQRMEIVNTAALFLKQITQKWTLILLRFSTQLLRFSVPRAY